MNEAETRAEHIDVGLRHAGPPPERTVAAVYFSSGRVPRRRGWSTFCRYTSLGGAVFRLQVYHTESGFWLKTDHASEDHEELYALLKDEALFSERRYRVVDDREPEVADLHLAAHDGDVEAIARLAAAGADVNARDEHGNTPLKYATAEPVLAAVRKLIELGADVNLADDRGFTPLHCAAAHGFYPEAREVVEALLARGADANARSREFGFVPLHEATGADVIRLLVARGADPNIRSNEGQTPLEYMIECEELDDAEHLRRSPRPGGAA